MARYESRQAGHEGEVFSHLDFDPDDHGDRLAADGVSCSLCHQIGKEKLGTRESFVGGFVIDPPNAQGERLEYGPFPVDAGHVRIMRSSSEGFRPVEAPHIRQSEVCATCHSLYTTALGPGGKPMGELPEQVPYQEWLHSDYRQTQSCQSCHMPAVEGMAPIASVLPQPRSGVVRHSFIGGNFFMLGLLNRFRNEQSVVAEPQELSAGAERTRIHLQTESSRLTVERAEVRGGRLEADIAVENLAGHKLPTAYPSRRAWLHVVVRDRNGRAVFESGALSADGSIQGNDNDTDAARFEPHYTEVRAADQVQIYEPVLADHAGAVTTGLLAAVRYLKDNRLLPRGFDKRTAHKDVAVIGHALEDNDFTASGDRIRYSVAVGEAPGPFRIEAELRYQTIGFRWASNLRKYDAEEPRRFISYYDAMSSATAVTLSSNTAVSR
jgi:mono/diheme cytochrome c family protein